MTAGAGSSDTGTQGPATDGSSAMDITYQYDVRGQFLEGCSIPL